MSTITSRVDSTFNSALFVGAELARELADRIAAAPTALPAKGRRMTTSRFSECGEFGAPGSTASHHNDLLRNTRYMPEGRLSPKP